MRGCKVPWRRPGALAALAGLLLACWLLQAVPAAAQEVKGAPAGAPALQVSADARAAAAAAPAAACDA